MANKSTSNKAAEGQEAAPTTERTDGLTPAQQRADNERKEWDKRMEQDAAELEKAQRGDDRA